MDSMSDLTTFLPLLPLLILAVPIYLFRKRCQAKRESGTFAFFHPYCDAGGGGERVLWRAINSLHQRFPDLKFTIFTGDIDRTPAQILEKAHSRFGIAVHADRLQFVFIQSRWLLEARYYPRLTLLGQMFAGLVVACEALWRCSPQWFIDTTGCPMSLPVFRLLGQATTLAYVHYPTITTEMSKLVDLRTTSYNNSSTIAASPLLTKCKLLYYRGISFLYRCCGRCSQLTMVNGSWTAAHIAELWACKPRIVFPPCDTEFLAKLANRSEQTLDEHALVSIISVGQIRPEKNHLEQLRIFAELSRQLAEQGSKINVQLIIAGGCRDEEDHKRVEFLQNYARGNFQMKPGREVHWELNVPIERLMELMQDSMIGLHTMWNEHFGISVVEGMAAGLIMVAHKSGGPRLDIIEENGENPCGFLAGTSEEYVAQMLHILLKMTPAERDTLRENARNKAQKFSEQQFDDGFCSAVSSILSTLDT